MIPIPRDLVWDYAEPPESDDWRLQRIAEFFPQFGRDRPTVAALYRNRGSLKISPEVAELIVLYAKLLGVADDAGGL